MPSAPSPGGAGPLTLPPLCPTGGQYWGSASVPQTVSLGFVLSCSYWNPGHDRWGLGTRWAPLHHRAPLWGPNQELDSVVSTHPSRPPHRPPSSPSPLPSPTPPPTSGPSPWVFQELHSSRISLVGGGGAATNPSSCLQAWPVFSGPGKQPRPLPLWGQWPILGVAAISAKAER